MSVGNAHLSKRFHRNMRSRLCDKGVYFIFEAMARNAPMLVPPYELFASAHTVVTPKSRKARYGTRLFEHKLMFNGSRSVFRDHVNASLLNNDRRFEASERRSIINHSVMYHYLHWVVCRFLWVTGRRTTMPSRIASQNR